MCEVTEMVAHLLHLWISLVYAAVLNRWELSYSSLGGSEIRSIYTAVSAIGNDERTAHAHRAQGRHRQDTRLLAATTSRTAYIGYGFPQCKRHIKLMNVPDPLNPSSYLNPVPPSPFDTAQAFHSIVMCK